MRSSSGERLADHSWNRPHASRSGARRSGRRPKGVELIPLYDCTELVDRTIHTIVKNLIEEAIP